MKITIRYKHGRNLFKESDFRPFVHKYFKDVEFEGFECGNWYPSITISNWDEIKKILPKSYMPESILIGKDWIQILKRK